MEGFDTRTHIRDPKSGRIIHKQVYQLHATKDKPSVFVRDGVRYAADGSVISEPSLGAVVTAPQASETPAAPKSADARALTSDEIEAELAKEAAAAEKAAAVG